MTTVTNAHSTMHLLGVIAAPFRLAHTVTRRIRARREMNRLLSFPEYLLKDVGVQRHDIQREAVRPLWHE